MNNTIFDSWEVLNDNTIIKKVDWSFFKYNGSGIPKQINKFFKGNEKLSSGDKLHITLIFGTEKYQASIKVDKTKIQRTRIFWHSDLGHKFKELFPQYENKKFDSYPALKFDQINLTSYNISFTDNIDEYSLNDFDHIGQEGKQYKVQSIRYERNTQLRQQALAIHGYSCLVCGFNFIKTYGEVGRNFIHIHHINPLSETGEQIVNPKTDLAPVCPNCHCMIHRDKNHILTIEELRSILNA